MAVPIVSANEEESPDMCSRSCPEDFWTSLSECEGLVALRMLEGAGVPANDSKSLCDVA